MAVSKASGDPFRRGSASVMYLNQGRETTAVKLHANSPCLFKFKEPLRRREKGHRYGGFVEFFWSILC